MVRFRLLALAMLGWLLAGRAEGVIVWSDLGEVTVRENGTGADITGAALKRDDTARDVLYFKFRVDPLSDVGTELYCAAFQLFEGERGRLAIGNWRSGRSSSLVSITSHQSPVRIVAKPPGW